MHTLLWIPLVGLGCRVWMGIVERFAGHDTKLLRMFSNGGNVWGCKISGIMILGVVFWGSSEGG